MIVKKEERYQLGKLEDYVFHQTHLPRNPRIPEGSDSTDPAFMDLGELLKLVAHQEKVEYSVVSPLNSYIAIPILSQIIAEFPQCNELLGIKDRTFVEANEGKFSYEDLITYTEYILRNIDLIDLPPTPTDLKNYTLHKGFYRTEMKRTPVYILTGRIPAGQIFVGLVPSTMTAVCLLSEGRSTEVIGLGVLILRMLNKNWKL